MKATINITGQINGNHTLLNALSFSSSQLQKGRFGSYSIKFHNIKEAKDALKDAWEKLKSNEPEYCQDSFYASFDGESIKYDASKAEIHIL